MTHAAPTIPWPDAPAAILARVAAIASPRPVVVAVSGPVGAGKSTLARLVSPCVLSTDSYLPDYDALPVHERDEPRHADFARLAADLADLRAGRHARVPVWSFQSHRREGDRALAPAPVIVLEGIHALHEPILPLLDVRVFIESSRGVRWERWAEIERSGQRGWGVERARDYFDRVAEPTFDRFAATYRSRAHLLVCNGE